MANKISDIGEFGLIGRIRKGQPQRSQSVILGIGDDAAAFSLSNGMAGLITTDTLVDKIHFDLSYTSFYDLGWKTMAANLSDIAAMGGRPLLAVVSLTLTRRIRTKDVDEIYRGMRALAEKYQVTIAGGDIVRGRELSLTMAIIGECARGNMGLRSGARPGDAVLVTGTLGASRAGLELLKNSKCNPSTPPRLRSGATLGVTNKKTILVLKHFRPEPRVREGQLLAKRFKLRGMIDISDGLASELHHLAQESRTGIIIDQSALPVSSIAKVVAGKLNKNVVGYCLYGGEEYELLFTLPLRDAVKAKAMIDKAGTRCAIIGQVVKGRGVMMIGRNGSVRALPDKGYVHF